MFLFLLSLCCFLVPNLSLVMPYFLHHLLLPSYPLSPLIGRSFLFQCILCAHLSSRYVSEWWQDSTVRQDSNISVQTQISLFVTTAAMFHCDLPFNVNERTTALSQSVTHSSGELHTHTHTLIKAHTHTQQTCVCPHPYPHINKDNSFPKDHMKM